MFVLIPSAWTPGKTGVGSTSGRGSGSGGTRGAGGSGMSGRGTFSRVIEGGRNNYFNNDDDDVEVFYFIEIMSM